MLAPWDSILVDGCGRFQIDALPLAIDDAGANLRCGLAFLVLNPELSPEDRQKALSNMRTIILASNRRVDITLSNAGQRSQESRREYPFNAVDSLTLLQEEGTRKPARPVARKKAKPVVQP